MRKRSLQLMAAITLAFGLTIEPAHACMTHAAINLNDVTYADAVLIGRVSNYKIVRDLEFRRKMLANPNLPADDRKLYTGKNSLLSDYARFDVFVIEALTGKVPRTLTVTWDNSTFGELDKLPPGPFLIALRRVGSNMPPLRGPSAPILSNREPRNMTVLQAPCSSPFLFLSTSPETRSIRKILNTRRR